MAKKPETGTKKGPRSSPQEPRADAAPQAAESTEMEVAICDDQQAVADATPVQTTRKKARSATLPTGATQAAEDAKPPKSKKDSTAKKRATTAPVKAQKTAKKTITDRKSAKKGKRPTSKITIGELADSYLRHLEAIGKSAGTVFSYGIEMKTAVKRFGAGTKVTSLTTKKVQDYFESGAVTKNRKGKPKSKLTIDKTRRVLRLALTWLAEVGVLKEAPIPDLKAKVKAGK